MLVSLSSVSGDERPSMDSIFHLIFKSIAQPSELNESFPTIIISIFFFFFTKGENKMFYSYVGFLC